MFNMSKHKRKKPFISKIKKEEIFIIKRFDNNDIIFERFKRAKRDYRFRFRFRNFIVFFKGTF